MIKLILGKCRETNNFERAGFAKINMIMREDRELF